MANTNYRFPGAVQPPESSPSGNQYKSWPGAVEPQGATASAGGSGSKPGPGLSMGMMGKLGSK